MFTRYRKMEFPDLAFAAECARASGWISETAEELENFLLCDSRGCWVAESSGRRIAFGVARWYGRSGFAGIITQDGARGRCAAQKELLERVVRYLTSSGSEAIFAEAGESAVEPFEEAGFVKVCRILQFTGTVYGRSHDYIRCSRPQDLSAIACLDRHSFRANRLHFLGRRYSTGARFCKVLELNGQIEGYIMGRRGIGVVPVGPWVVSANVDCPADLLESLAIEANGEKMVVNVLEASSGAVELLRTMGLVESREPTWRMLLGSRSNVGMASSLFAIGSPFMG